MFLRMKKLTPINLKEVERSIDWVQYLGQSTYKNEITNQTNSLLEELQPK